LTLWRNLSIAKKLYGIIGIMAILIAGELFTLQFAMKNLSAVRAFVGGEGLWSKSQKDAISFLIQYGVTRDEKNYQHYLEHLKIPDGDHQARLALSQKIPDLERARAGFLQGQIHPDDIEPMLKLLTRFSSISYVSRAVVAWSNADRLLEELKRNADHFHQMIQAQATSAQISQELIKISEINRQLTFFENEFSIALGEGSRWMEGVVVLLLFGAILIVEGIGLSLTVKTTRMITSGLQELNEAAQRVARGERSPPLKIRSSDEIGTLASSLNLMAEAIQTAHDDLEQRVRDRTNELEQMAATNAKLYEEAKNAVQSREDFLSIATHELRTPLTTLSLQLQLLERMVNKGENYANTSPKELIKRNLVQTQRLSTLLDELLDLTKLRQGKLELKLENFDLSTAVSEMIAEFGTEAAKNRQLIEFETGGLIMGRFDFSRIRQVLTNLVSNALKYGNKQPITVKTALQDGIAYISVKDRGMGIPAAKRQQIFERYERANEDHNIAGLGLGLYISSQIVRAHHGQITVASEEGQGSVFTVELPLNPLNLSAS
jgi:signal transduction histidine kinase